MQEIDTKEPASQTNNKKVTMRRVIIGGAILLITLVSLFCVWISRGDLFDAAIRNDTLRARVLLFWGADPNEKDDCEEKRDNCSVYTPFITAIAHRSVDVVKILIDHQANVNADQHNYDYNHRLSSQEKALHRAIETGNTEIVRLLIEAGADVNAPNILYIYGWSPKEQDRKYQHTPLMEACSLSYIYYPTQDEIVELLIKAGADINARDGFDRTALMNAVGGRQAGSVKLLIEAGAEVNAKNYEGETALDLAEELLKEFQQSKLHQSPDDPLGDRDPNHNIDKIIDLLKAAGAKHGNEL